jgi:WD40 repeat protein
MQESLDASLVRIRAVDGGVIGAGFLVGERQILTCAHVVSQAFSLIDHLLDVPQGVVSLDFPLISPRSLFTAKVVQWCPLLADGRGDIAGLELLSEPPSGAEVACFAEASDVWEHPFRAFGFPVGYDDGVWATGRLLGRQATDWVMIEDVKAQGFAVGPGFSGTPVWDTQLQGVVGMVVAASRPADTKAAFVLPLDVLVAAWPRIEPITRQRVFLSAAPADAAFADRLAADLEARDIVVWSEQHTPGEGQLSQEERLQQAVRAAQAVVLVVSSQTRSSRTVKEHLRLADLYARRLILVGIGNEEPAQAPPPGWRETVWVDARDTHYAAALDAIEANLSQRRTISALLVPTHAASEEESKEPRNPYKGLRAFTADDAQDFFGRDRLVDELVKDVARALAAEQPATESGRLVTIIGPSGSGKSSVAMAGLLPRLQRGALPGSEAWVFLSPMAPGKHPIEELGLTLAAHFPDRSFTSIREDLEDDATRGLHVLTMQLVKRRASRVVLLVDQFEELFTQTESEDERQRFIDLLLTATTEPHGTLLTLLTLRADFYDRPMQYPALNRLMQACLRQVLPMDVEDLHATIVQPAALSDVQLTFEGNLVGDLLFEVQGQVGALPLLQFTLEQLFERRSGHRLTLQAYHEIDGVKGALAKHAEATYAGLPSEEHRRMARALFLRLIDPGVTEQDTTRRRATLKELSLPTPEQTTIIRAVADTFVTARLLTTNEMAGSTTIEVSHEALIREWDRLTKWLREAREDFAFQKALANDTAEWVQRGKPTDRLYSGSQLTEMQAWAERNHPNCDEAAFLQAAEDERISQKALVIEQKEREAALQRRVITNQRWLISALSVFSVVVLVLGSLAVMFARRSAQDAQIANQQAQIALSRSLAFATDNALSQNKFDLALLLSYEATQLNESYDTRNSLLNSLKQSSPLVTMLRNKDHNPMRSVVFGPTNSGLLVSTDTLYVYVWNTKKPNAPPLILNAPPVSGFPNYIGGMALSPNGQKLALSSPAGVWLQDIQTGLHLVQLVGRDDSLPPSGILSFTPITFSEDGQHLLSTHCDHYTDNICTSTKVSTWDVATNQLLGKTYSIPANADTIAFNLKRQQLATINGSEVQFWNVNTGDPVGKVSTGSNERVTGIAFSPDGSILATVSGMNIKLWNITTDQPVYSDSLFTGQMDSITDVAFSPDGTRLAASSRDKTVLLWNVKSGELKEKLIGDPQPKLGVAFSPDGAMLTSWSNRGTVLLWRPSANNGISLSANYGISLSISTKNILNSVVYSPDGKVVFAGSIDGKVFVIDGKTGQFIGTLSTNTLTSDASSIVSLAIGGDKLAAGRADDKIVLWNIKTDGNLQTLVSEGPLTQFTSPPHLDRIMLSSDGRVLAASGDTIQLWDVTSGTRMSPIYQKRSSQNTYPLDLSPDGKQLALGVCTNVTVNPCDTDQIQFWDVMSGKISGYTVHTAQKHDKAIYNVAFSLDGQTLALSSSDGITLWDMAQRPPREGAFLALPAEEAPDSSSYNLLLFNSDGKRLVSYTSADRTFSFIVWNLAQRPPEALVSAFKEKGFSLGSLAITLDGQSLASFAIPDSNPNNGIFTLWDISISSWQRQACSIANRNLTLNEWNQFAKGSQSLPKVCSGVAT